MNAVWRSALVGVIAIVALVGTGLVLSNAGGWRARVVARLLRVNNPPVVVSAPDGFRPNAAGGFTVSVFADGFVQPRWLAVAPNGDVFVAESAAGQILVLRPGEGSSQAASRDVFADGLQLPFGIAFRDSYVYVANTNEVVRFRYDVQSSKRLGNKEHVLDLPGLGYNGHWTRSLVFSADKQRLFVSVGSRTNVSIESDGRRATILLTDPEGRHVRTYATGLRNPVGIAIEPVTGDLWTTVNERDDLGDEVPQDYLARVLDRGFYGWPYSYAGRTVDNRVTPRPDLVTNARVPELLLGAHVAPLQMLFYEGQQFPPPYRGGAFIAEHGSWNRKTRSGYEVVFVPFEGGKPTGAPSRFLFGFAPDPASETIYGRPVGVTELGDGSLLVSDDGAKVIWRVSYQSTPTPPSAGRSSRAPLLASPAQ